MKNLTSVEFLKNRIESLRTRFKAVSDMSKYKPTGSLVDKTEKLANSLKARNSLMNHINNELRTTSLYYNTQFFKQSKYGVKTLWSDGDVCTVLLKCTPDDYTSDRLHRNNAKDDRDFLSLIAPLSLEEGLRYSLSDQYTQDNEGWRERHAEELEVIYTQHKIELLKHIPQGLSCISREHLWMYCKLPKMKCVLNQRFLNARMLHGGVYVEGSGYNCSYNWIRSSVNHNWYPIQHARKFNTPVLLTTNIGNKLYDGGRINSLSIEHCYRSGWFDTAKFIEYDSTLYSADEMVKTNRGRFIPKDRACWVEYKNAYYASWDVVELKDGGFAPDTEVISCHGDFYLRGTEGVQVCKTCGEGEFVNDMKPITSIMNADIHGVVCQSCHDGIGLELRRMDYDTNVLNIQGFGSTNLRVKGEPIYLGLELETYVDFNDSDRFDVISHVNTVSSSLTYAVATEDPSLSEDHGIEFIFRPEGLLQQKRNVKRFLRDIGNVLGYDAGDKYGLHIHISKNWLTDNDVARIDNFVSVYQKFFREIGGRDGNNYQEAKRIKSNKDLKTMNHDRYAMVNATNNNTVEFRFPKSLACEVHICTNLELILATSMFAKYHLSNVAMDQKNGASVQPLQKFFDYVRENSHDYPLLSLDIDDKISTKNIEDYLH